MKSNKTNSNIISICPDKLTAAFLLNTLKQLKILQSNIFLNSKTSFAKIKTVIEKNKETNLFVVLSSKNPKSILNIVEQTIANNGFAFIWKRQNDCDKDAWLLTQLLVQKGAFVSENLSYLLEIARISQLLKQTYPSNVFFKTGTSEIGTRLAQTFKSKLHDLQISNRRLKNSLIIELNSKGLIHLILPSKEHLLLQEPELSVSALNAILSKKHESKQEQQANSQFDKEIIELIAQPPKRLLSETASTRLAQAFNIPVCQQILCNSANKAIGFAAKIDDKIVLKLIRPSFENKQKHQAVITSLSGRSKVGRAYQSLVSLGEKLGSPAPLGILAAQQISGGLRGWVKMHDHSILGKLLLVGQGDSETENPKLAFSSSVKIHQVLSSLKSINSTSNQSQQLGFAKTIVMFGQMVKHLGGSINRAEMHPIVALDDNPAMALDVLIEVSG